MKVMLIVNNLVPDKRINSGCHIGSYSLLNLKEFRILNF